jgi:hypothetical protein
MGCCLATLLVAALAAPAVASDAERAVELERRGFESELSPQLSPIAPDAGARARALDLLGSTGLLLVPESTNDRVMAFDPLTGDLVDADFVPSDPTNLGTPIHALLNTCGLPAIHVSDQINDVVHAYDLDGGYLGVFAPPGGPNTAILDNIRGLWTEQGYIFLVTVGGGTNQDAIAAFDPTSGFSLGNFVTNGLGGLDSPFSAIVRWDVEELLVAGIDSDAVHRYSSGGAYLGDLTAVDGFPEQIALAANGNVLIANFSGAQEGIVEVTAAGAPVGVHTAPGLTGYRGVYELPSLNLLVTTGTGVHEIDRAGNLVETKIGSVSARFIQPAQVDPERLYVDGFEIGPSFSICWSSVEDGIP